jgi:hypothetical protein
MKRYPSLKQYVRDADALAERVMATPKNSQLAFLLAAKVQALAEAARAGERSARKTKKR